MLEDPIQDPKTVTCGPFQLYFYENLFTLDIEKDKRKVKAKLLFVK